MAELNYQSPLKWPSHTRETPVRMRSYSTGFQQDLTISAAVRLLEEEVTALSPDRAILYTDYDQIKVERLRNKKGNQPGASLELRLGGRNYIFACDRWSQVEQNIYALHLIIRNYRLMEKWGVANLPKLMHGFLDQSLQTAGEKGHMNESWMQMLGLGPTATIEDAHAVYRRRAKLVANDGEALIALNNAMDEARKKLGT